MLTIKFKITITTAARVFHGPYKNDILIFTTNTNDAIIAVNYIVSVFVQFLYFKTTFVNTNGPLNVRLTLLSLVI